MRELSCSSYLLQDILLSLLSFAIGSRAKVNKMIERNVYVVYMGAAKSYLESPRDNHLQLLSSVLDRKDQNLEQMETTMLVRSYKHAISGFTANLSKKEAERIAGMEGVVSVFEDHSYKLHTTRSWDFLQSLTDLTVHRNSSTSTHMPLDGATDTIIGLIDTGIWPESKSFDDKDMGPIPKRWKGVCMQPDDYSTFSCNRKLIGARYYVDETPRDKAGHGTHTASTAAGNYVPFASYYNLAEGTAKGGSPPSRIAVYKTCIMGSSCSQSAILSAFDDAIADGVDVISVSMGGNTPGTDFLQDPIAIGAFHAVENGITVICSAGNDGPASSTLSNTAPWIITVAATTIDRVFESNVILGGEEGSTNNGKNMIVVKKLQAGGPGWK